jgi:hypothetical protein
MTMKQATRLRESITHSRPASRWKSLASTRL